MISDSVLDICTHRTRKTPFTLSYQITLSICVLTSHVNPVALQTSYLPNHKHPKDAMCSHISIKYPTNYASLILDTAQVGLTIYVLKVCYSDTPSDTTMYMCYSHDYLTHQYKFVPNNTDTPLLHELPKMEPIAHNPSNFSISFHITKLFANVSCNRNQGTFVP